MDRFRTKLAGKLPLIIVGLPLGLVQELKYLELGALDWDEAMRNLRRQQPCSVARLAKFPISLKRGRGTRLG
jgi:hypothetical protein